LLLVGEPGAIGLVELQILGAQLRRGEARVAARRKPLQHVDLLVAQPLLEPGAKRAGAGAGARKVAVRRGADEILERAPDRLERAALLFRPARQQPAHGRLPLRPRQSVAVSRADAVGEAAGDVVAIMEVAALPARVAQPGEMGDPLIIFEGGRIGQGAGEMDGDVEVAARADAVRVDGHQHRPARKSGERVVLRLRERALPRPPRVPRNRDPVIERLGVAAAKRGGGGGIRPIRGGRLAAPDAPAQGLRAGIFRIVRIVAARLAPIERRRRRRRGDGRILRDVVLRRGFAFASGQQKCGRQGGADRDRESRYALAIAPQTVRHDNAPLRRARRRVHEHYADEPCIYGDESRLSQ
jgi:hypothetical protein